MIRRQTTHVAVLLSLWSDANKSRNTLPRNGDRRSFRPLELVLSEASSIINLTAASQALTRLVSLFGSAFPCGVRGPNTLGARQHILVPQSALPSAYEKASCGFLRFHDPTSAYGGICEGEQSQDYNCRDERSAGPKSSPGLENHRLAASPISCYQTRI